MKLDVGISRNVYLLTGIATIALLGFGMSGLSGSGNMDTPESVKGVDATVYKSPNCGCCSAWANYAEKQGMNVEVKQVKNLEQVKQRNDIPTELGSCHTTIIENYVVEGHVPVEAVAKLLDEEPDARGIGLPGMPQGSPGMPGPKSGDWDISSFTENGETSSFMTV